MPEHPEHGDPLTEDPGNEGNDQAAAEGTEGETSLGEDELQDAPEHEVEEDESGSD